MPKGKLIIITAPSGAGKTTLVNALLKDDDNLRVSVSHTTRPGRLREQNGINYHFIDEKEFMSMLSAGEFLENAEVYGHHYGTSQRSVNKQLDEGYDVILEIDWHGAAQVRNVKPEACFIFILPPSIQALTERLTERAQDNRTTIESRMQQARSVLEHVAEADYIVVNDKFKTALSDIQAIIHSKRLTVANQEKTLAPLLDSLTKD